MNIFNLKKEFEKYELKADYVCCERCGARIQRDKVAYKEERIKDFRCRHSNKYYCYKCKFGRGFAKRVVVILSYCVNCYKKIESGKKRNE